METITKESVANNLKQKGVLVDDNHLLMPNISDYKNIKQKIFTNLESLKDKVDSLRLSGKHVLYMPGSYDLIHLGHAFYIDKAIEWYLTLPENENISRHDIVVLVLADDDSLISQVKSNKWVGNGGSEPFKRPIQSSDKFKASSDMENWRLVELASVPYVDIVGFIPSPENVDILSNKNILSRQKSSFDIEESLNDFLSNNVLSDKDINGLRNGVRCYEYLVSNISNPDEIIKSFKSKGVFWSVQAWQLFIHIYLASGDFSGPFVRVTSENDVSYKDQVNFIMQVSGIKNIYIDDYPIISTSELLSSGNHEKLLEAKNKGYKH
jgi:hypothetical protein